MLNLRNMTIDTSSLPSVFSTGDYKMIFNFVNGNKEELGQVTIIASMSSSNKDTFG